MILWRLLLCAAVTAASATTSSALLRSARPLSSAALSLSGSDDARIVIISLAERVQSGSRADLAQWLPGAVIGNYIAHDAFLVLATPDNIAAALRHAAISHVGILEAEHKIARELLSGPPSERAFVRLWDMGMRTPRSSLAMLLRQWQRPGGVLELVAAIRPAADGDSFTFSLPTNPSEARQLLMAIGATDAVQWIEPAPVHKLLNANAKPILRGDHWPGGGIDALGLTGAGEVIGVADSGLDVDHCFYWDESEALAVMPSTSATSRKVQSYWPIADLADEKDGHGTHVVGSILGHLGNASSRRGRYAPHTEAVLEQYGGMAPDGRVAFADVGLAIFQEKSVKGDVFAQSLPGIDVVGYKALYARAYDEGARLHSDSWGGACRFASYNEGSRATDAFLWEHKDFLTLFAAGNAGPAEYSIGCPATHKNGLTIGASENVPDAFKQAGYGISLWANRVGDDSCQYAHDGVCDEPSFCEGLLPKFNCTAVCTETTDAADCTAASTGTNSTTMSNATTLVKVSDIRQADFGPRLYGAQYAGGLNASIAFTEPLGACSPLTNAHQVRGRLAVSTVSSALLDPGSPCTFVRIATHVMEAGALGLLFLSHEHHLLSDDTAAAANVTIPAFILAPSEVAWQLLLTPLFPSLNASVDCYEAVTQGFNIYQYLESQEQPCVDDTSNPDSSHLSRSLACLSEGIDPNRTVEAWLRFNESALHASHGIENLAWFSSRGPTLDGRVKPDLVAPGHAIISARSDGHPYTFQCDEAPGPSAEPLVAAQAALTWMSGTSMATPLASGSAALVRQYFGDGYFPTGVPNGSRALAPSAALVKAMMIHGSHPIFGKSCETHTTGDCTPLANLTVRERLHKEGFGRLRLDTVLRQPSSDFELFKFEYEFAQINETAHAVAANGGVAASCEDTCGTSKDSDCDDGGPGAEYTSCPLGTDCSDCGPRGPPSPPDHCTNACKFASDGECDDGGVGATTSACDLGTDCDDCGPRGFASPPPPPKAPPAQPPPPPSGPQEGWAACIDVPANASAAVRATLVWTDFPGDLLAELALVNDLSLVVQRADGTIAAGVNGLADDQLDELNNVEQATLPAGESGELTVRVVAERVPHGPQPFALVLSGPSGMRLLSDGTACSDACPLNCSSHGQCAAHGRCLCDVGFSGLACAAPTPPPPAPPPSQPPAPPPTPPGLISAGARLTLVMAVDGASAGTVDTAAAQSGLSQLTLIPASSIEVSFDRQSYILTAQLTAPIPIASAAEWSIGNASHAELEAAVGVQLPYGPRSAVLSLARRTLPSGCCCSADGRSGELQTAVSGCAGTLPAQLGGGSFCFVTSPSDCPEALPGLPGHPDVSPSAAWRVCFPEYSTTCSLPSPPLPPLPSAEPLTTNTSSQPLAPGVPVSENASLAPASPPLNHPSHSLPPLPPAGVGWVLTPRTLVVGQPSILTVDVPQPLAADMTDAWSVTTPLGAPGTWLVLLPFSNDASCTGAATASASGGQLSASRTLTLTLRTPGHYRLCASRLEVPLLDSDYDLVRHMFLTAVAATPSPSMLTPPALSPPPLAPSPAPSVPSLQHGAEGAEPRFNMAVCSEVEAHTRGWWMLGGVAIGLAAVGGSYLSVVLSRRVMLRKGLRLLTTHPVSAAIGSSGAAALKDADSGAHNSAYAGMPKELSDAPGKLVVTETEAI